MGLILPLASRMPTWASSLGGFRDLTREVPWRSLCALGSMEYGSLGCLPLVLPVFGCC